MSSENRFADFIIQSDEAHHEPGIGRPGSGEQHARKNLHLWPRVEHESNAFSCVVYTETKLFKCQHCQHALGNCRNQNFNLLRNFVFRAKTQFDQGRFLRKGSSVAPKSFLIKNRARLLWIKEKHVESSHASCHGFANDWKLKKVCLALENTPWNFCTFCNITP